jgi:hypothetical protein
VFGEGHVGAFPTAFRQRERRAVPSTGLHCRVGRAQQPRASRRSAPRSRAEPTSGRVRSRRRALLALTSRMWSGFRPGPLGCSSVTERNSSSRGQAGLKTGRRSAAPISRSPLRVGLNTARNPNAGVRALGRWAPVAVDGAQLITSLIGGGSHYPSRHIIPAIPSVAWAREQALGGSRRGGHRHACSSPESCQSLRPASSESPAPSEGSLRSHVKSQSYAAPLSLSEQAASSRRIGASS